MPIYEYKCKCGEEMESFVSMHDFNDSLDCPYCCGIMKIKVSLPGMPNFGFKPFSTDNITGENVLIESRAHKKELMSEHGVNECG